MGSGDSEKTVCYCLSSALHDFMGEIKHHRICSIKRLYCSCFVNKQSKLTFSLFYLLIVIYSFSTPITVGNTVKLARDYVVTRLFSSLSSHQPFSTLNNFPCPCATEKRLKTVITSTETFKLHRNGLHRQTVRWFLKILPDFFQSLVSTVVLVWVSLGP